MEDDNDDFVYFVFSAPLRSTCSRTWLRRSND